MSASDRKVRQEMLIVVKIILVAFAVFGQSKLFPEKTVSTESSLDSLVLPAEKPELALVKRAIEAQGLCPTAAANWPELGMAAVDAPVPAKDREIESAPFKRGVEGNSAPAEDLATCY
jgi:hypothetical protein